LASSYPEETWTFEGYRFDNAPIGT
jgi:hypothetical protein